MKVEICVIASGSKGNCTYITDGTTRILIDAGVSCRRIETALTGLGTSLSEINAILVTHDHIDHTSGLHTIQRRYDIPILANTKTAACVDNKFKTSISRFCKDHFDTGFKFGTMYITPFRTSHDAVCSVGYTIVADGHKIAYLTDVGVITQEVRDNVLGCEVAILESNHDLNMLDTGNYPPEIKARVRSDVGHLNNIQSASFAVELVKNGAKQLILAHLSEQNNTPSLALKANQTILTKHGLEGAVKVLVAKQNEPTQVVVL